MTAPSSRLGLAVIAGCTGSTVAYAVLRLGQKVLVEEPDPALVIWSEHAGFYWRCWIAAYVGGMLAFAAWLASARAPATTARALGTAIVVASLVIAAQGLLVP